MEIFSRETSEGVARLRARLEQTGYVPYEKARYFQFVKSIDQARRVKFDLHARLPIAHEEQFTKVDVPRVGSSTRTPHPRRSPSTNVFRRSPCPARLSSELSSRAESASLTRSPRSA